MNMFNQSVQPPRLHNNINNVSRYHTAPTSNVSHNMLNNIKNENILLQTQLNLRNTTESIISDLTNIMKDCNESIDIAIQLRYNFVLFLFAK